MVIRSMIGHAMRSFGSDWPSVFVLAGGIGATGCLGDLWPRDSVESEFDSQPLHVGGADARLMRQLSLENIATSAKRIVWADAKNGRFVSQTVTADSFSTPEFTRSELFA